jgi:hypothetical protein
MAVLRFSSEAQGNEYRKLSDAFFEEYGDDINDVEKSERLWDIYRKEHGSFALNKVLDDFEQEYGYNKA